jgi:hypothetical protein
MFFSLPVDGVVDALGVAIGMEMEMMCMEIGIAADRDGT